MSHQDASGPRDWEPGALRSRVRGTTLSGAFRRRALLPGSSPPTFCSFSSSRVRSFTSLGHRHPLSLQELIRRKRIEELKSMLGKVQLEIDLPASRRRPDHAPARTAPEPPARSLGAPRNPRRGAKSPGKS